MRCISSRVVPVAALFGVPLLFALGTVPVAAQEESVEDAAVTTAEAVLSTQPNLGGAYTVTPIVANETAKPRDIIKKELMVTNNTAERLDLYVTVENVDPTNGSQAFVSPGAADLSQSLANWIEITRGVIELGPNESRKIPYLIHINLTARPGSYFARIAFGTGPSREAAEAARGVEGASLMLNVEVEDDAKERLELGNFLTSDGVVLGKDVSFSYLLENVGNRSIEPRGSIRIFNRRGEEVGSVPLNASGDAISPETEKELAAVWDASHRFGKYKAFLDLEYGENQLASVQDTVYFWVFPWKEVLMALVGVVALAVAGTFVIHLRSVARPVRARAHHAPVAPSPEPSHEPVYTAAPVRQRSVQAVTHIVPQAERKGATIELRKREPAAPHYGATIELPRRSR